MAVMAIKEEKKSKLGPIITKKLKLKKENKEIGLTKDSIKKHKKPNQEIEDTTTNKQLLLKPKKKKKKHVDQEISNVVQDEVESLRINDSIEESDVVKLKKQKKSKKNKLKTTDDLDLDEDKEEVAENTVKKIKKKKRKFSETDLIDSDNDSETNEEVPPKKKKEDEKEPEDPELKARTVFVGNIPLKTSKKAIQKFFKTYGKIESIRIRGLPGANPKLSKKVVAIKQEFHPGRNNFICFIRYFNKEDALKAEAANGALFERHHLRVNSCLSEEKPDESKAIFIGNLSFDATEDELWKLFEDCGPISHVRIIRDTYTGMGKGFAYVNFKDNDAVQLALEMEDVKLRNRVLRITLCNSGVARKNKKTNKMKQITKPGQPRFRKPFKKRDNYGESEDSEHFTGNKRKEGFTPKGKRSFQGSKFTDKKKKFKKDKGDALKKKKINMIAPKTE